MCIRLWLALSCVTVWGPHSHEIVAVTLVDCVTNTVPRARRMGMPSIVSSYHLTVDPLTCIHTLEK